MFRSLRDGEERVCPDRADAGMLPARERLGSHQFVVHQVELGLEDDFDFTPRQRGNQVRFDIVWSGARVAAAIGEVGESGHRPVL